jgi:hypothetical protein
MYKKIHSSKEKENKTKKISLTTVSLKIYI